MESTCANCESALAGPYCSQCGEKRFEAHHLSFKHFLHEVAHELTHLDGHLGRTLRLLFTRPGALAEAYLTGKRSGLIRPLRLYLILSLPSLFLAKNSVVSLQYLVAGTGPFAMPFAPAIAWGAKQAGLTEAAYLASRNSAFQGFQCLQITYLSTALAIGLCFLLWHKRRSHFGEHAVFALYAFCATDLVQGVMGWLVSKTHNPVLMSIGSLLGFGYMFIYIFLAARRVYGDGRWMTLLKVGALLGVAMAYGLFSVVLSLLVALPLWRAL